MVAAFSCLCWFGLNCLHYHRSKMLHRRCNAQNDEKATIGVQKLLSKDDLSFDEVFLQMEFNGCESNENINKLTIMTKNCHEPSTMHSKFIDGPDDVSSLVSS